MGGIYRVRHVSQGWGGGPGLNTFYYAPESPGDPSAISDAEDCASAVRAFFDAIKSYFPTDWTGTVTPTVDVIDPLNGELETSYAIDPPAVVTGTSGAGFGPTPVMMLVRLLTSTVAHGSRVQGRAFIGPVLPASDGFGTPSSTIVPDFTTAADLLDTSIATTANLAVWHRPREARAAGPDNKPTALTAHDGAAFLVTAKQVPDKFAVLRSRRD